MIRQLMMLLALSLCACGGDGGDAVPEDGSADFGAVPANGGESTINCDESGNPQICKEGACAPVDEASPEEEVGKWLVKTKIGDIIIDGVIQCGANIRITESVVETTTDLDTNSGNTSS